MKMETDKFGLIEIRHAMFDIDGTNLEEGIEIKGEEIGLLEFYGWQDIDELNVEKVEQIIIKKL